MQFYKSALCDVAVGADTSLICLLGTGAGKNHNADGHRLTVKARY